VAIRWRIRHKLWLGFALVIAVIGLLLAGTFKGLWSYRSAVHAVESKMGELGEVNNLVAAVQGLSNAPKKHDEATELKRGLEHAQTALTKFEKKLDETIDQGRALQDGFDEKGRVQDLRRHLKTFEQALKSAIEHGGVDDDKESRLIDNPAVKERLDILIEAASDLNSVITDSLSKRMVTAREDEKTTRLIVLGISIGGLLLLALQLRRFYLWVFRPIQELEKGAKLIAQGNFGHHIEVHSADELEDLAAAFNHMTDRLHDLYTDLNRQVNERSRQLVRSERLASVGFLAAGVAHEINNPLASIAFCSEALDHRLEEIFAQVDRGGLRATVAGKDRETIGKYLKMIQDEAFRCKKITQRLLEFSRGGERTRGPVDLNEVIQGVLDVAQHLQNCKGKELIFQPASKVVAWVNAQEINQVVLNLVVNALESMDEDGTLTISLRTADGQAEMCFKDTGCGMDAEVLENLFEPFFTRSRTGKGTGLGLSISHRIINEHGGEIEASSAGPDRGSTFVVRLPLKAVDSGHAGGSERVHEVTSEELERQAA
jgi:signal transduction histidine kinase